MKLEVKFDERELKSLLGKLRKATKENPKIIQDELNKAGLAVETGAKKRTIVDTGRLRSSIHMRNKTQVGSDGSISGGKSHSYSDGKGGSYTDTLDVSLSDLEVAVGTDVVYAYKIHSDGGVRTNSIIGGNGKGFLFNAQEEVKPELMSRLKEVLSEIG